MLRAVCHLYKILLHCHSAITHAVCTLKYVVQQLFCYVCITTICAYSGQNLSTGPSLCSFYIIYCIFIAWPNQNAPNVLIHFALVLALKSRVVYEIT